MNTDDNESCFEPTLPLVSSESAESPIMQVVGADSTPFLTVNTTMNEEILPVEGSTFLEETSSSNNGAASLATKSSILKFRSGKQQGERTRENMPYF